MNFISYYWGPYYYEHLIEFLEKIYDYYDKRVHQNDIKKLKKK